MSEKKFIGKINGQDVHSYTLCNAHGMKITVADFGATLLNVWLNDVDVACGYQELEDYLDNGAYLGCVVAPNANRIATASVTIDGQRYPLQPNDGGGENNLHTHTELGANKKFMKVEEKEDELIFYTVFPNMEAGLPGNRYFCVSYSLTEDNRLVLTYGMLSDSKTIFNPTHHCYWNLAGHNSGTVLEHTLQIEADAFTPVGDKLIPTGEIRPVAGTTFDFRQPKAIGRDFDLSDPQQHITRGYDHNFVLRNYDGTLQKALVLCDPHSGREMTCYTTQPGVQVYTGNYLETNHAKEHSSYHPQDAVALETQFFPDCNHQPDWLTSTIPADMPVVYQTVYAFKF